MNESEILTQLTGSSPRHLLEDLARIGAALAKNERSRPEIEIFLASGHAVRGRIISIADDPGGPVGAMSGRQGAVALVQVGGSVKAPSVTFVRIDQIVAITVVDASLLVRAGVSDAPVPSKLELQRQAASCALALASAVGRPLAIQLGGPTELDDDGRRAIGLAMPLVLDVLTAISSDEMGREALNKIEMLELGSGNSGDIRVDAGRLVIRAPKLLTEQYTHATLRKAIEKLL